MSEKPETPKKAAKEKMPMGVVAEPKAASAKSIKVTGPKAGRRRAGFVFNATPTVLDIGKLSDEQLYAIEHDPMLTVEAL